MMLTKIIPIGNSKGLRLNKAILEKYDIHESVELVLKESHIEIRPLTNSREGWGEQFKKMHTNGDDRLIMDDVFEDEQFEEWK